MQYIRSDNWDGAIHDLTTRLVTELSSQKKVLWLLSGGSNITAAVKIIAAIPDNLTTSLSLMLVDERYGPVGHPESNWQKLMDAGFKTKQATALEVLQAGMDFAATTEHYNQLTIDAFANADIIIAQLGIGEDGHIAGIMVGSDATGSESELVTKLITPELQRMTINFTGLRKIDATYTFAFGESKHTPLHNLERFLSLQEQPSQILKELPESYVYNDEIGGAS